MDELPPTLGAIACDWMETYLVHGPGDIEGQPFRLDDEKRAFIYRAYEYVRDQAAPGGWRRRYRRAVLSRRKGFAKSELAAGASAFELLGPARLDGLDADGQPVGRPVKAPNIPMAATSEDQAEETLYGAFKVMVGSGEAVNAYDVDITGEKTTTPSGKAWAVTSSSSSRDGGKPTFTPFDETHLWFTPQLLKTYRTMRRNLAKLAAADPWALETTTSFLPGEGSVAEASYEYGMKVLRGEVEDPTLLFDHLAASFDWDLDDADQLRAAILEASGEAGPWTNVAAILDEFADPGNDPAENRRYWLNQVVAATNAWIAKAAWQARAVPPREIPAGTAIALGFDGGRTDDATALVACTRDGYLFPIDGCSHGVGGFSIWEKPDGELGRGWRVNDSDVNAAVARAFDRYRVVRFYPDPPHWQDEVTQWVSTWGDIVMPWWTNRDRPMYFALERVVEGIGQGGKLSHDGNPTIERHVGNARKEKTNAGHKITKPAQKSIHKIDAAMAVTLAFEARADALEAGEFDTDDSPGEFYAF